MDKLRSGKYSREASLNLLRQPAERCRQMLYAFIRQAGRDGLRNLITFTLKCQRLIQGQKFQKAQGEEVIQLLGINLLARPSPGAFWNFCPWMSRWHFSVKGYNRA